MTSAIAPSPLLAPTRVLVHTVGHSSHAIDRFVALLARHSIDAIADVRSQPYSRFTPQFNREPLRDALKAAGIAYVFLGRELGARSEDPSCYVGGRVQYDLLAETPLFRDGLRRVEKGVRERRVALMCAEKDPLTCHRTILVCRRLAERGIEPRHILEDGRIETHEAALERLLSEEGIEGYDLFRSREDLIADAYARRGARIGFVERAETDREPAWNQITADGEDDGSDDA